ncbi:MAG TPA: MoxR family ATPase [Miltoncostaeales bacterium]|jgi:MoxR-like ATPase|nr:MoxR family ATPase [Miltoncostaeales bacterium]
MEAATPTELAAGLQAAEYLADDGLSVALFLALSMHRPLLLEGEPGVGKTEAAKALARTLGAELIRLQCYEGIDAAQALYEWDYARQLLAARAAGDGVSSDTHELFSERFLVERPLLRALRAGSNAVLLIDELDRADDEFEAFLLEILAEYTITIPELGTIRAPSPPAVIITSNRTRELHDALKRRCLYHWLPYPDRAREVDIIRLRVPEADPVLAAAVAEAVARLRELDLAKPPGPAEAIDWTRALHLMGAPPITPDDAQATLGWVVKSREDQDRIGDELARVIGLA